MCMSFNVHTACKQLMYLKLVGCMVPIKVWSVCTDCDCSYSWKWCNPNISVKAQTTNTFYRPCNSAVAMSTSRIKPAVIWDRGPLPLGTAMVGAVAFQYQ